MNDIFFSTKGFKNIPTNLFDNNFTFRFNDRKYKSNIFYACFISPKISRLVQTDPFIKSIDVPFDDKSSVFENVQSMLYGKPLYLSDENIFFYHSLFHFLENDDFVDKIAEYLPNEYSINNVCSILSGKKRSGLPLEGEPEFIAKAFSEIPIDDLALLDLQTLTGILSNRYLKIESEGSLLNIIKQLIRIQGDECKSLYNYILFENLTNQELEEFLEEFDIGDLTGQIWNSFCHRMFKSSYQTSIEEHQERYTKKIEKGDDFYDNNKFKMKKAKYYEGMTLNGILSKLSKFGQINLNESGIIQAYSSSVYKNFPNLVPGNVLNTSQSEYFMSNDAENSWIAFDFKKIRVEISYYELQTYGNSANSHLKSWVLEVSNDEKNWHIVDTRNDIDTLNAEWGKGIFKCSEREFGRYVRLRQTGPNHRNSNCLLLCSIEFYGQFCRERKQSREDRILMGLLDI